MPQNTASFLNVDVTKLIRKINEEDINCKDNINLTVKLSDNNCQKMCHRRTVGMLRKRFLNLAAGRRGSVVQ